MTQIDPVSMIKLSTTNTLDRYTIYKILSSSKISTTQKSNFIKKHASLIDELMENEITPKEFKQMMEQRPLIRFRPIKNSLTKHADDIILAKSLNIETKDIRKAINSVIDSNFEIHDRQKRDEIEKMKPYIYRHGTKAQVRAFLEYELSDVKTTLQNLYLTMSDNSGGLADYFSRPIHRMDNKTLENLYLIIDKSIDKSYKAGAISKEEKLAAAQWALIRIYQIQNNSKVIRAYQALQNL